MTDEAGGDATSGAPDGAREVPRSDPLVIRSLEFAGGLAAPGGWRPDAGLPEVAFSGRSNVGKSSLLNRLVRRKALARVSQHPGKTREINFFRVNDAFLLVDLPGYGYARVSKEMRGAWRRLIEGYLRGSEHLRGIVQLIDARHPPSPDDRRMLDFLAELGLPTIVALTKADKLRVREVPARVTEVARDLQLDEEQIIAFSAVTGAGRDVLAAALVSLLAQPSWKSP
jgi:GTP-binding protein